MKSGLPDCVVRPAVQFSQPVRRGSICLLLFLITLSALGLTGCGPKRLRADFTNYERSYAETSNRELLLNLARLENREPTYFFKIGSIQSLYKMGGTLTGNGSYSISSSNATVGGPAGGGSPMATYENDPSFTFIPVNDQTNAELLLQQVPPNTFYILYEQGWRVDQLFRLMVDRVELTTKTKDGCDIETIRNLPPPVYANASGSPYSHNQDALSQYTTFLRISAILYWLQQHGDLLLRVTYDFVPYDTNAALKESQNDQNGPEGNNKPSKTPSASDIITASSKNAVWEKDKDGNWLLGEKVQHPVFYLAPIKKDGTTITADIDRIETDIQNDPDMGEMSKGPALHMVLTNLVNGFTITGSSTSQNTTGELCPASSVSSHLVMRSLIGLMAAAAQEQTPFEALMNNNPHVPMSDHLKKRLPLLPESEQEKWKNLPEPTFSSAVPAFERIPLLRLKGEPKSEEVSPIIQVSYRGNIYRIADLKNADGTENQYWNRDVFRLINELTSQVTVDISKFPLTTILQ